MGTKAWERIAAGLAGLNTRTLTAAGSKACHFSDGSATYGAVFSLAVLFRRWPAEQFLATQPSHSTVNQH
ncbi:hypothetical protein RRF57_006914 [Xylaria bambusicola]|uniref:Uncharacterized protein n=1 Tax=Xylaria bambusicola TaxID=326684 RepID=A0AAN7UU90_9PEZI